MELTQNQRLKILRAKHNLSQKEVADALDMTNSGYSALEKGKIKLNQVHLIKLKEKLKFDIDYILEGSEIEFTSKSTSTPQWADEILEFVKAEAKKKDEQILWLQNHVNQLMAQLGKLKGNQHHYSTKKETKKVAFMVGSVTPLAQVANM